MIVTIEPHPYFPKQSYVAVNGKNWRLFETQVLRKCPKGSFESLQDFNNQWQKWESKTIKSFAISKLSRRRLFTEELAESLKNKGFSPQIIGEILSEFQKLGYLNDSDEIDSLINKAIRLKKGPLWIAQQFRQRGVSKEALTRIETLFPRSLREEIILNFIKKKKKEGPKLISALIRQGFNTEEIYSVYNNDQ